MLVLTLICVSIPFPGHLNEWPWTGLMFICCFLYFSFSGLPIRFHNPLACLVIYSIFSVTDWGCAKTMLWVQNWNNLLSIIYYSWSWYYLMTTLLHDYLCSSFYIYIFFWFVLIVSVNNFASWWPPIPQYCSIDAYPAF